MEKKDNKPAKVSKGKVASKTTPPAEPARDELPRERHNSGEGPKDQRKGILLIQNPFLVTGFNVNLWIIDIDFWRSVCILF